ncbi:MAG TPA: NAD+ synthase [Candidatus Dormibacteraeota bacterium]|nr:NAD+ synthase [Candidatus Dormibacteraeota bacterium]
MRIALAQINPIVGDLEGNARLIVDRIGEARDRHADLVCFPELALTGYPPEDLVLKPAFVRDNLKQLEQVVQATTGISVVVGFVDDDGEIFNAAAFIRDREVKAVYHKVFLPNYGVFDEERYFAVGHRCPIFEQNGMRIGVTVCEDCWYPSGPMAWQADHGAELLVNINGSPFHAAKRVERERMVAGRAADYGAFLAYVNTVGGQDELVFDGNSVVFGPRGEMLAHASSFREELLLCDIDAGPVPFHRPLEQIRHEAEGAARLELDVTEVPIDSTPPVGRKPLKPRIAEPLEGAAEIYAAVVLGTRDYIHKQRFKKVIIGLSGGVDSALTATVAADALGPENVIGVRMPSRHTSDESLEDAAAVAESLGIELMDFPIEPAHRGFEEILADAFTGTKPGIAEENVQPRIRMTILHALSNKFGYIVLTTGNKSEIATGYGTLYGDIAGGFAVLKDITKTTVYELCRYRNSLGEVIPARVISKPPSAELKPGQKDTDSLPPYDELDPILTGYIEQDLSPDELVAAGHDPKTVARVVELVDRSEYKRRQAPPGVKITPRAFGRDRRMPITNRYSPNGARPADQT